MTMLRYTAALATLLLFPVVGYAAELSFNAGAGSQAGESQRNRTVGVDYEFFRHARSERQVLSVGVSYSYLKTDTDDDDSLHAVSIYPQLSLYPAADGGFRRRFPETVYPYFFVRALGPSYMSRNDLGKREQANNFAFQAQVGVGLKLELSGEREARLALSWKHFSNANLFSDNDGYDVPLVLNFGVEL